MQFKSIVTAFLGCVAYAGVSTQVFAQAPTLWDNCPENGILTNPSAPVNPQNPAQLNTFNWQNRTFSFNGPVAPYTIASPFFQPQNNLAEPLRNTGDQRNSEGWELITQGFGFVSLGVPATDSESYPYYILYNKHTAIMRVFMAGASQGRFLPVNAYQIRVAFARDSHQSSLLMLADEPAAIFDKFIRGQQLVSGTDFNNYNKLWVYADFPMTYYPCACNFKSRIYVDLQLITTSKIKMVGISTGTLTNVQNGAGDINQRDSKWTLQNAIGAGKKASETYNSIGSFTNKQLTEIENAKTDDKTELPLKTAKDKQDALNAFQSALFNNQFLKDGLKAIPYIGAAVSFLDSFFGGGATASQEVKLMPMAINMTTTYEGTIVTQTADRPILIDNPGTKDAGIAPSFASEYPAYNEAMGTFTVLTLPKINSIVHKVNYSGTVDAITADYAKVYRLTDELMNSMKYALNPASGLDPSKIEIKAALVFEFDNNPNKIIQSLNGNLELEAKTPQTIRYRSPYMPISAIFNQTAQYGFRAGDSLVTTPNRFSNSSAFPIVTFSTPKAVFLKIIVNLERINATPETQNILYVQTFRLDELVTPPVSVNQNVGIYCNFFFYPPFSTCYTAPLPVPVTAVDDFSKMPENIVFRTGENILIDGRIRFAWGSIIVQEGVTYTQIPNQRNLYFCDGAFYETNATPIPNTCDIQPMVANLQHNISKYTPQASQAFIKSACATTYKANLLVGLRQKKLEI